MIKEIMNTRQIKDEPRRRWFSDEYFDLIIWLDGKNLISGFQLCYDKNNNERALTWHKESGYTHHRIDCGENRPGRFKATPILVSDGIFDFESIADSFSKESKQIDKEISSLVKKKIKEYKKFNALDGQ